MAPLAGSGLENSAHLVTLFLMVTHTHQPQVSTVICPLDRALSGAGGHPLALRIWMASLIMTVHNLELPPTFGKSDYKNSCKEKSQSSRVTWS